MNLEDMFDGWPLVTPEVFNAFLDTRNYRRDAYMDGILYYDHDLHTDGIIAVQMTNGSLYLSPTLVYSSTPDNRWGNSGRQDCCNDPLKERFHG